MRACFDRFTLDRATGRLTRDDGCEVRLRPQTYRLLEVLAAEAPRVLSQEELLDRVWGVEHLSPASVKQAISELRQALGDDPARPRIIETVHRRGYRFIASLSDNRIEPAEVEPTEPISPDSPSSPISPTAPTAPNSHLDPDPGSGVDGLALVDPLDAREGAAEAPADEIRPPDLAPRRRGSLGRRALWVGIAVAVVLGGFALARRDRAPARTSAEPGPGARPVAARPTLAILGFRNLSGLAEDAWIDTALAEILGFELTAPGTLRVLPVEGGDRMRSAVPAVPTERAPGYSVTGSYLVSPGRGDGAEPRVRIQIVVADARTGESVAWARQSGTTGELLELATAAARGILSSLGAPRAPAAAAAIASDGASLRLWAEAMDRLRVRDARGAVDRLAQAARTDPRNPFVHDALARAWSKLGFDGRAAAEARVALDLAGGLPEEIRLGLSARAHETRFEIARAAELYRELWKRYPDNLDYGLSLAATERQSGRSEASFATVEAMRRLPAPDRDDPRIDLAEADGAWGVGDFPRSRDAARRAIAKAERRGARLLVAAGRVARGWALVRLGDLEEARGDFRVARGLYERAGDRAAAAGALAAEAVVDQTEGRSAAARASYEAAIALFHQLGDRTREAKTLNNLAALIGEDDLGKTAELLERSLAIKREIEDRQGMALTLANLASVSRTRGDAARARRCLEEALALDRELGDSHGLAQALRGLAEIALDEGRIGAARAALVEAQGLSREGGDALGEARAELIYGRLERSARRPAEAARRLARAIAAFRDIGDKAFEAAAVLEQAELDGDASRVESSRQGFARGLELALAAEDRDLEAAARWGLGRIAARGGDAAAARVEFERALALWTAAQRTDKVSLVRAELARLARPG